MRQTIIGACVRRSNRNFLILNLAGLSILTGVLWCWGDYFIGLFAAPGQIDPHALLGANSHSSARAISLPDAKVIDTGLEEKREGRKVAEYVAYPVGDRYLIVKLAPGRSATSLSGYLSRLPYAVESKLRPNYAERSQWINEESKRIQRNLAAGIHELPPDAGRPPVPPWEGRLLPLFLDTTHGPSWLEYLFFLMLTGFGVLVVAHSVKALRRIAASDLSKHPIVRELRRLGDPEVVAASVDEELQAEKEVFCKGRVMLTRSWLLYSTPLHLSVLRLADVTWVFKRVTQHRTNGVRTGRDFALIVRDCQHCSWEVRGKEKEIDRLLQTLAVQLPFAFFGYDAERDSRWLLNPAPPHFAGSSRG